MTSCLLIDRQQMHFLHNVFQVSTQWVQYVKQQVPMCQKLHMQLAWILELGTNSYKLQLVCVCSYGYNTLDFKFPGNHEIIQCSYAIHNLSIQWFAITTGWIQTKPEALTHQVCTFVPQTMWPWYQGQNLFTTIHCWTCARNPK